MNITRHICAHVEHEATGSGTQPMLRTGRARSQRQCKARWTREHRQTLGVPEDNMTVNVTLLGGGFDASRNAICTRSRLLFQELGAPVKVRNRHERTTYGIISSVRFRWSGIEAGLDEKRRVIA